MNRDEQSKNYLKLNKVHRDLVWLKFSVMNDPELADRVKACADEVKELLNIIADRLES